MLDTLIFSTVLFAALVAIGVRRGRVTLANPLMLYFAFHFFAFLWRAWRVTFWPDQAMFWMLLITPTEEELSRALLLTDLGLVAICAGFWFVTPVRLVDRVKLQPLPTNNRTVLLVGAFFIAIGAYAFYRFAWSGGMDAVSTVAGAQRRVMVGSTAYLTQAPVYAGGIGTLFVGLFGLQPWVIAYLTIYYGASMVRGGGRWTFVLGALSVVLVDMWRRKARWPRTSWIIGGLVLAILFGLIGSSRTIIRSMVEGGENSISEHIWLVPKQIERDLSTYEYLVYVVKFVPQNTGWSYGTQYLKLFTMPIPRMLWPNKPIETSTVELNGHGNFIGAVTSVVGDMYLNAGWITVALGMLLLGSLLGGLHRIYQNHRDVRWVGIVYALALSLLPLYYRDGGIVIFVFLFMHVLPAAITLRLASGTAEVPWYRRRWLLWRREAPVEAPPPSG